MERKLKRIGMAICMLMLLMACSDKSEGLTVSQDTTSLIPENLIINAKIAEASSQSPNGDGSGLVRFYVAATHATSYTIRFGDDTETSTTVTEVSHTYNHVGVNNYLVEVLAHGQGENYISSFVRINVLVRRDAPVLVWSDEFSRAEFPNVNKWTHDIGTGNNGWGNNEVQYYTNRNSNAFVSNGTLKITAKKENAQDKSYTSARLKTQEKIQFKYGTVEVRAKLPMGGGTWPAIWMLGANINEVGWPSCGEIDIMEHRGNFQNTIHTALHYPERSAGNAIGNSIVVPNVSTTFHIYKIVWTASKIEFFVNDLLVQSFVNLPSSPFHQPFFIILNVAMGGHFGGIVDNNFSESSMEIDYVRIYQ